MVSGNDSVVDKVPMEEDDIHEIGEEEKEKLNDVDYLTGNPLPTDVLLYAVPVCGPYNALQSYKYRVKIIPGTAKKGKGNQNFHFLNLDFDEGYLLVLKFYLLFPLWKLAFLHLMLYVHSSASIFLSLILRIEVPPFKIL